MLKIEKLNNSVYVEGVNHALWPYDAAVAYPFNSLVVELDESDIATFHSAANYDVVFSGKISEITIEGETVTKDNICEKFGAVSNVPQGGGGLTPEQEEKLNNAVQTDTYNADKEAQAQVDENQDAAINGKANVGDSYTKTESDDKYQPKGDYLTEETDPVWNAEKGNYYTKAEADTAIENATKDKADKSEIPSLDGYATEEYVNTEVAKKQDIIDDLEEIRANALKGGNISNIVTDGEAPEGNVGIGIFEGEHTHLAVGSPIWNGDWLVVLDNGNFYIEGENELGSAWKFWNYGNHNYGGFDNYSKYYTADMVEMTYTEVTSNFDNLKYIHLRPDFLQDEPRYVRKVTNVMKVSDKSGVYIYDGTDTPSKVATEKNLEGYYTKTESDGKYQPKGNYPTFNEMQASLNGKADKTTTYTKTQVDTALSGKTNTDLDNLSDAGKDNLKKMIQGGNAQIENGHVITADEAAMKWTIDFDEDVDIHLTKGDDWYGVLFIVDGTRLNVYGDGGHEGLIRLYEKDTDIQRPIYDGEGYSPVALDNYYIKITEGYTLTYAAGSGKLVSQQPSMFEETDPIYTADKPNIATKADLEAIPLKTINGESIKGDGNITIEAGNGYTISCDFNDSYKLRFLLQDSNNNIITDASYSGTLYEVNGSTTLSLRVENNWYVGSYYTNNIAVSVGFSKGGKYIASGLFPLYKHLQQYLKSGTNIKTINGGSILGSGNIETVTKDESITLTATLEDGSVVNYTLYGKEV